MKLINRHAECAVLDGMLEAIRAGESRALVVSGEPGVGKTALLEYLSEQASGCRLARAAGVQSEMELPFAGLHQLCALMLGQIAAAALPPCTSSASFLTASRRVGTVSGSIIRGPRPPRVSST